MRFISTRLVLVLFLLVIPTTVFAQTSTDNGMLPTDLVFYAGQSTLNSDGQYSWVGSIVLLDHSTLTFHSLGVDGYPITWSPDGEKLAYLSRVEETIDQGIPQAKVCILIVDEGNSVCLEESVGAPVREYSISWSADSTHIYVPSYQLSAFYLYEVNTRTGVIIDTVYESTYQHDIWGNVVAASWTPDVSHIALGTHPENSPPGILVDLSSNQEIDLEALLLPFVENYQQSLIFFSSFSSKGTYLVGHVEPTEMEGKRIRLVLFDTEGHMKHVIELPASNVGQPTWNSEETKLYIPLTTIHGQRTFAIFDLETGLTDWYVGNNDDIPAPALILSPNETHISFVGLNDPYGTAIYVLYPDDQIRKYCEPEYSCHHPAWRPNTN